MNTALSGSGRVDDIKSHPQGEIRWETKLVKITEDVRKYAAEHGMSEDAALEEGLKRKRPSSTKLEPKFTRRRDCSRQLACPERSRMGCVEAFFVVSAVSAEDPELMPGRLGPHGVFRIAMISV